MKNVVSTIVNVLCWIFVICAAVVTIVVFTGTKNDGLGNLFGYMPYTVQTQSMEPTIKVGDMIIGTEVKDVSTLKEDDIITFWTTIEEQKALNTHRIVSIEKDEAGNVTGFITKGDNNAAEDKESVKATDVVSKYMCKIGGVGKAMDFLQTQKGFFICIVIPLAVFFLYQFYNFIAVIVSMKKDQGLSEAEEEELKKKAVEEYLAQQKKESAKNEETAGSEDTTNTEEATTQTNEVVEEASAEKTEE